MAYRNKTYVAFDGDNDMWAYRFMKGWSALATVDFNFYNAHDIDELTERATDVDYIKKILRKRLKNSKQFILLVGESTKTLRKYVKWEIEVAIELEIPIIVCNLNGENGLDTDLCPKKLQSHLSVHGPFKKDFIKKAIEKFADNYSDYHEKYDGPFQFKSFNQK